MTRTEFIDRIEYERVEVPEALTRACTVPDLGAIRTNGDMEAALAEAVYSLAQCNADKEAIARFSRGSE